MHLAVTWDVSASEPRWTQINDRMREALKPYSWVRPLSTFYIVKVSGGGDRKAIMEELESVAKSETETVHFLISPIMSSGRYNGFLPNDKWETINKRTD